MKFKALFTLFILAAANFAFACDGHQHQDATTNASAVEQQSSTSAEEKLSADKECTCDH